MSYGIDCPYILLFPIIWGKIIAGLVGPEQNLTLIGGRGVALANLPSSLQDFVYILLDEWERAHPQRESLVTETVQNHERRFAMEFVKRLIRQRPHILQSKLHMMKKMCSMFAGS
jgi:hypothetical protein